MVYLYQQILYRPILNLLIFFYQYDRVSRSRHRDHIRYAFYPPHPLSILSHRRKAADADAAHPAEDKRYSDKT